MKKAFVVPAAAALFAVGSTASAMAHAQEKPLIIGTNNWAENVAVANLWKLVLDDQGYDVELSDVGKSALFAGLANATTSLPELLWTSPRDTTNVFPPVQRSILLRRDHMGKCLARRRHHWLRSRTRSRPAGWGQPRPRGCQPSCVSLLRRRENHRSFACVRSP